MNLTLEELREVWGFLHGGPKTEVVERFDDYLAALVSSGEPAARVRNWHTLAQVQSAPSKHVS